MPDGLLLSHGVICGVELLFSFWWWKPVASKLRLQEGSDQLPQNLTLLESAERLIHRLLVTSEKAARSGSSSSTTATTITPLKFILHSFLNESSSSSSSSSADSNVFDATGQGRVLESLQIATEVLQGAFSVSYVGVIDQHEYPLQEVWCSYLLTPHCILYVYAGSQPGYNLGLACKMAWRLCIMFTSLSSLWIHYSLELQSPHIFTHVLSLSQIKGTAAGIRLLFNPTHYHTCTIP